MDSLIFCTGNSKCLICPGVNYLINELGITLKKSYPVDKYCLRSERLKSIPEILPAGRREILADWGYYAAGTSRSLRCFYCHSLANVELVDNVEVHPSDLHSSTVVCEYRNLAIENSGCQNIECRICLQKYKYGYVILKCGHGVYCYKCLYTMEECPLRCGVVKGFARAYIL